MSFPTLPPAWVDRIFATLAVTYGSDWLMKWEGVDAQVLKATWAKELGGLVNRPDMIEHALNHLPVDRPPNVLQFRVICFGAPEKEHAPAPQLPGMPPKKADISRLHAAMARYKELREIARTKPKQWAYDLQEREKRGEALSEWQRQAWREVLAKVDLRTMGGPGVVIENDRLPPAMRRKET